MAEEIYLLLFSHKMNYFINTPSAEALPSILPIFPLNGTLILPGTELPLHIFEERYREMFQDSLRSSTLIGIVQPRSSSELNSSPKLYDVGCIGRIIGFRETEEGRYFVTLHGVCRFELIEEVDSISNYRQFKINCNKFIEDLKHIDETVKLLDRNNLFPNLKKFLSKHNINIDLKSLDSVSDSVIVQSLSMTCPFEPNEKQVILEAENIQIRADIIYSLIEMASKGQSTSIENSVIQ